MYGICAKATGTESRTESLHPTLQHVADEGGREGIFYEVPACAAQLRSATGGRDVRTLWVLENFINEKFVTRIVETTLTATWQANDMYDTLNVGAGKGTEM